MPRTTAQQERSLQDPAVCELLKIRDFLDNVMVRTDSCYVVGFRVQGSVTYFADDEGRNEAKRAEDRARGASAPYGWRSRRPGRRRGFLEDRRRHPHPRQQRVRRPGPSTESTGAGPSGPLLFRAFMVRSVSELERGTIVVLPSTSNTLIESNRAPS